MPPRRGQVPTFNDNGIIVNESLAALLYLEEAYPSPTLMPGTPGDRALVRRPLPMLRMYPAAHACRWM
jgi:glutathione S-transferase